MTRALLRPTLAAFLAAASAAPALAHAHLAAQTPPAEGTSASPEALTLRFTEPLEPRFSGVALTGPGGAMLATGPARLAAEDAARLIVPLTGRLAPGLYTVDWHAVARDGHRTTGRYRFTVAP